MDKDRLKEIFNDFGESLFEDWYKQEEYCSDPKETFWWDFDEDKFDAEIQEQIESENPENPEKFKEDELEKQVKEKAREWFDERKDDFLNDIDSKVEFLDNEHIKVFRCLKVKEQDLSKYIENLKIGVYPKGFSGVGNCWSFTESNAIAHHGSWRDKEATREIVLYGVVPLSSINLESTFMLNMNHSCGADETEIRVKDGEYIHLEEIEIGSVSAPEERIIVDALVMA